MDLSLSLSDPVRRWFDAQFPGGPTAIQAQVWPAVRAGSHVLAVSPTGTGKTLAAFLAILDRLLSEAAQKSLGPGVRAVYLSPLRSLSYDIERNLRAPLDELTRQMDLPADAIQVAVRTGDTSPYFRRRQRDRVPHLLLTTPESLSLLLTHASWRSAMANVENLIVDEVHALAPTKRGADLAVSLERVAALAARDPVRIGLSATCRPSETVARFLCGPGRPCTILEADPGAPPRIRIEPLLADDEASHRALSYRRLLRRLEADIRTHRTTVIFANTRALAERITHDLRRRLDTETEGAPETVAAHHSALDSARRREVESALQAGTLRAVVTSTSLELGVDIGSADLVALIGLPGSVSRCLQRVGRAGHQVGATSEGVLYAATAAEIAGAAVTVRAANAVAVEPIRPIRQPLDVLCQQLLGMACAGETDATAALSLVKKTYTYMDLAKSDLDACLAFLAGDLAAPPGAFEPEPGAPPRWTAPRIWRTRGLFGVRSQRVLRWFRMNVGTITSEESVRVTVSGRAVGTLEGAYAERLQVGDRFVLDGRALEFRRLEDLTVHARPAGGDADLPRWTSDRQALSSGLARDVAVFRHELARRAAECPPAASRWLHEAFALDAASAGVLLTLIESQQAASEVPGPDTLLVEESPYPEGFAYTFHAPLNRAACEVLGRAAGARLGRRFGRDIALTVADLGWSLRLPDGHRLNEVEISSLMDSSALGTDALEGIDRGDLPARRFRHVAATAMMVLRNPEGGRRRVGGLLWVSQRLFPLVRAACPDHPLLRETRREVLDDLLDHDAARSYLDGGPTVRFRRLEGPSPFTAAWIDPAGAEPLRFEPPASALQRLHARLTGAGE